MVYDFIAVVHDNARDREETISNERVIHDSKQIRNPSELCVGRKYKRMYKGGLAEGCLVKILSLEPDEEGLIKVEENLSSENPTPGKISLADMGVAPYENGQWNILNYLLPAD